MSLEKIAADFGYEIDEIESLAQEHLEKIAISPELAGKAQAMRSKRVSSKLLSGGGLGKKDIDKMDLHAQQGMRQANKGNFGKYLASAAKEHGHGRLGQLSARVQGSLIGKVLKGK